MHLYSHIEKDAQLGKLKGDRGKLQIHHDDNKSYFSPCKSETYTKKKLLLPI